MLSSNELLVSSPPLVSILSNRGVSSSSSGNLTVPSSSAWSKNTDVIDLISCSSFLTEKSGNLTIDIQGGMPRILIASINKGGLCPNSTGPAPSTSKKSAGCKVALNKGVIVLCLIGALVMVI